MKNLIFLIMVNASFVCADFNQALTFYNAGEYKQAQKAFEELEQEHLLPWQRAVVMYNLATTYLAQNQLKRAMTLYNTISLNFSPAHYPLPLLKSSIATNYAIARLRQAQITQDIDLYRDALQRIAEAEKAACHLEKFKGREPCQERVDFIQMRKTAKMGLAALITTKQQELLEDPSVQLIIHHVNQTLSHVRFLKEKTLNDKLKKRYRDYFIQSEKEWIPLWDALQAKMQDDPEAYTLITQAEEEYKKGVEEQDATIVSAALDKLKTLIPKEQPNQLLSDHYQYTLSHGILNQSALSQLLEMQQHLSLPQADREIKKALAYLKTEQQGLARIHVLAAYQNVKQTMRETKTPLQTLHAAIEDQKYAIHLNRLVQLLEKAEESEAMPLLNKAQQQAGAQASPFLQHVYQYQEEHFQHSCQKQPWNEALPLFIQGIHSADEAQLEFMAALPSLTTIQAHQETTLHEWQTAFDAIVQYQPTEMREEETPINEVLQLLQEMEQQDRPKQPITPVTPIGEDRPW